MCTREMTFQTSPSPSEGKKNKIKKVLSGSHLINPLLICLNKKPLTREEFDGCQCSWYEDETNESTRVISFINDEGNYQGTTQVGGNSCKTMLVLQNKKTNKVQLIEVSDCNLGRVVEKPSSQTNYDNDEIQTTYQENKTKLLKAFGSKRSNRVSDIGSRMRINAEIMSSQIRQTAAEVEVDVKELELVDSAVDTCVPPCHRDATNAAEVYLLEDFLTQAELNSMEDEAFVVSTLMPFTKDESGYSQFFIDSLERLQNKVNMDRIKTLLFVEALFRFISLPLKKQRKKELFDSISPFSKTIAKKIIEDYTVGSGDARHRNLTMEDKVVIHIIVLIIIACESFSTDELSRCLPRFSVNKIGQIARALCLSTRDKVTWFLKLPLPPPRSVFLKRRK